MNILNVLSFDILCLGRVYGNFEMQWSVIHLLLLRSSLHHHNIAHENQSLSIRVCKQDWYYIFNPLNVRGSLDYKFTARNSSCEKVMFSQACIIPSVLWGSVPTPIRYYGIRSTSGRYASYWNTFLFLYNFVPSCLLIRHFWLWSLHTTYSSVLSSLFYFWLCFYHTIFKKSKK